jgi:hypothetical protein
MRRQARKSSRHAPNHQAAITCPCDESAGAMVVRDTSREGRGLTQLEFVGPVRSGHDPSRWLLFPLFRIGKHACEACTRAIATWARWNVRHGGRHDANASRSSTSKAQGGAAGEWRGSWSAWRGLVRGRICRVGARVAARIEPKATPVRFRAGSTYLHLSVLPCQSIPAARFDLSGVCVWATGCDALSSSTAGDADAHRARRSPRSPSPKSAATNFSLCV